KEIRDYAKSIIGEENFVEVYINAPIEVCEDRDVKGLYKKARAGEIKGFTGIDSPYEAPANPDFEIKTNENTVEEAVEKLRAFVLPLIKLNLK
ncbi:MAG: adenylyl-sulfate kinase, partial [Bacteroidota bacterium]